MRRASDQLAGLLKMHSLRDKAKKKRNYVRISSSVSELDSIDRDLDFLNPPRRPPSRSNHTPTTPTSPFSHSNVTLLTPTENHTEGDNPDAFVVSRFHCTQIRNRKRKQSPRIQRNISAQTPQGDGGTGEGGFPAPWKTNRSISESPTSSASRSLHQTSEDRSVLSNVGTIL